ncbi:cysteate racemase [Paraburkholderia ferrariae]|uniref:amino acid racemase n=1 Tax=Paraburkholderia ferrariae TaxID=386056 RepID=UPI000486B0C4|nr:amino acid racemase [Paraburkholderia ferrariae]
MNGRYDGGRQRPGVVAGIEPLASSEEMFGLLREDSGRDGNGQAEAFFAAPALRAPACDAAPLTAHKLRIFDAIRVFERRGATTVLLPCFASHTFIDELRANTRLPIVDMVEAVRAHVREFFPGVRRIGVLVSETVRASGLFERYFSMPEFEVIHARCEEGAGRATRALACARLVEQGAQVIVPGVRALSAVDRVDGRDESRALSVPLIDVPLVYAQYALSGRCEPALPAFKVGVLGGVGPAATVDFLQKIVRNTQAQRDQDHIKLLVEQNPQIPDRTENLIGHGADPTVSLYATCKRLEEGGADVIAIPCNTAHAFVERIQPYLAIPIVNMLSVTVRYLRETFPSLREVGVLATSGTIESGVYGKALEREGLRQIVPEPALQARVMAAIYGVQGVKAGHTTGPCQDDVAAALEGLIEAGVEAVILGCTELPLLLPQETFVGRRARVRLIDPTDVLARQCVARATGARG